MTPGFDPQIERLKHLDRQLKDKHKLLDLVETRLGVETSPLEREKLRQDAEHVRAEYERLLAEYRSLQSRSVLPAPKPISPRHSDSHIHPKANPAPLRRASSRTTWNEDTLLSFLEGLTSTDFARLLTRLPETTGHVPDGVPHLQRVAALLAFIRSTGGPGIERLIQVVNDAFPNQETLTTSLLLDGLAQANRREPKRVQESTENRGRKRRKGRAKSDGMYSGRSSPLQFVVQISGSVQDEHLPFIQAFLINFEQQTGEHLTLTTVPTGTNRIVFAGSVSAFEFMGTLAYSGQLARIETLDIERIRLLNRSEAYLLPEENKKDLLLRLVRQLEHTLSSVGAMEDASQRESTLAGIASSLAGAGQTNEALAILQGIEDSAYRDSVLVAISTSLARDSRLDEALDIVQNFQDSDSRDWAIEGITTVLTRVGAVDEALSVARRIENRVILGFALQRVSFGLVKSGREEEAKSVDLEAQQLFNCFVQPLFWDIPPGRRRRQHGAGKTSLLWRVQSLVEAQRLPYEELAEVANSLGCVRQFEEIEEIVQAMEVPESRIEAFRQLSVTMAQLGQFEQVLAAVHKINDSESRDFALTITVGSVTAFVSELW